ncbi:hypothetical protein RB608_25870 [Nocardioides sp. LHD-245]|uniref:hypothetical protein n=1 Tax=Nocardioides sp. LHD-245 TaxID=3051387 RepID=UPI0027E0AA6B|nr:hypothetical protein [Nocardioides sp. LHD-245]
MSQPRPIGPRLHLAVVALRTLVLCITVSVAGLPFVAPPAAHADTAPTPLVSQIADEPISVSAAQFRRHLFVAADAARLSDPSNTADLLAERVLQHVYALDPQADPAAAADAVRTLVTAAASVTGPAFDSRITRTMVLFQSAATADQGPLAATLQRATTELVRLTAEQITTITADTHAESALGTNGDTESRLLASATFAPAAVLRDSVALADRSTGFASARDLVWSSVTGASITASTTELLSTAPRLVGNQDVQAWAALRDQAGNLSTTGAVIAGTPSNPAPNTIGATMAELGGALRTTVEVAAASTGTTPMDAAVAEQAVEDARDSQTTLALQTGFLTGSTSAAKDIVEQVGATAIQATLIAMTFNDFAKGNIGRAALSANAIGVVMTLLPVVLEWAGVFGPSGEDLVMTQLDNISQQMADFQNHVTGQFTQVFESLSRVSAQLDDITQKLDRAVIDIEQARVQIGQLYDGLSRLQGSLDAVQNNILEALRNGTNSQLRQTINSALGYEERNGSALPLNEFNSAAAYLHTFVTVTARHSPELNTDRPSFDLQNDANQLSTGIASNVHFLDQVPVKRGWSNGRLSGLTGDAPQLANTDDFVLASRAYAQLMMENPRYVSAGYRRWLSDIQQQGTPLADLTSAISTPDTADGTRSTLLNHLVCERTSAAFTPTTTPACRPQTEETAPVDALVAEATGQLTGTVPGFDGPGERTPSSPLTTKGTATFDPFVNSSRDASDLSDLWAQLPDRDQVSQCGAAAGQTAPARGAMDRPASLTPSSQGVPEAFGWAHRMGLGTLRVCYRTNLRATTVSACQFGTQWMVVHRLGDTTCRNTYWDPGFLSAPVWGAPTTVQYKYDDIAFVWTYTPADTSAAPIYVQSLVRRGAVTASKTPARALNPPLPPGGYDSAGAPQTYISDVDLEASSVVGKYELANVVVAPEYAALGTAAQVRAGWADATTATAGVSSYQAATAPVVAGDPLDQPIAGMDPKLGSTTVRDEATQAAADSVDDHLAVLQGDVYRGLLRGSQTAGNTTSGPLHDALVRLDGANALLSSFLQLGASRALRERDLTSLPSSLAGSKELTDAIRTELAKTGAGDTGTEPSRLVADLLDPSALDALDGLLPPAPSPSGRARAAAGPSSTPGSVHPALLATNDQLTLAAIALGAPAPVAPPTPPPGTPVTPVPPSPNAPTKIALGSAWVSMANVGRRYKQRVVATGGTTYSWSRQGKLPRGLKGRTSRSGRSYVITGRPKKSGIFTFTLTVTDTGGMPAAKRYRIWVR